MRKGLDTSLGLVTSTGGLLEIGSIVTAAAAGAEFGTSLLWAVVLGGLCLALLVEMARRFTSVTNESIVVAMRARFGFEVCVVPLTAIVVVTLMVLATELAGVAASLDLATGIDARYWGPLVGLATWIALRTRRLRVLAVAFSVLGLVAIVFVVAAFAMHPAWGAVAQGLVPRAPHASAGRYAFLAAVILGASIAPALFWLTSADAIDDGARRSLGKTRAIAGTATAFGTVLAAAALVVASRVLAPRGIVVDDLRALPRMLEVPLGVWGRRGFIASLGIASFAACMETALVTCGLVAQTLGWRFDAEERRHDDPRVALLDTAAVLGAAVVVVAGVDPLKLTFASMALVALTLPVAVFPFLVLMNDEHTLGARRNRLSGNVLVSAIIALALVLSIVSLPLQIAGG